MRILRENKIGLMRLGIVTLVFFLIIFAGLPLKIYHFTLFNSGVSLVIGVLVLMWAIFLVLSWITDGFRQKNL